MRVKSKLHLQAFILLNPFDIMSKFLPYHFMIQNSSSGVDSDDKKEIIRRHKNTQERT